MVIRYSDFLRDLKRISQVKQDILRRVYSSWLKSEPIEFELKLWQPLLLESDLFLRLLNNCIARLESSKWSGIFAIVGNAGSGKTQFAKILCQEITRRHVVPLYFDFSEIVIENANQIINEKIQKNAKIGKPLVIIMDHIDALTVERYYEKFLLDIFILAKTYSRKPFLLHGRLIPISFIFVLNAGSWIRALQILKKENMSLPNFSETSSILVRLSPSIHDLLKISQEIIRKALVLLYLIRPENTIKSKITNSFSIIASYLEELSKFLITFKDVSNLGVLLKIMLKHSELFIKHLVIEKPRITKKQFLQTCRDILANFLKETASSLLISTINEKPVNIIFTPIISQNIHYLGLFEKVTNDIDIQIIEKIAVFFGDRSSLDAEKEKLLNLLRNHDSFIILLAQDIKEGEVDLAELCKTLRFENNVTLGIVLYSKLIEYTCRLEKEGYTVVFNDILDLSRHVGIVLSCILAIIKAKSLIAKNSTERNLRDALSYSFLAWINIVKHLKSKKISMLQVYMDILISPILQRAGYRLSSENFENLFRSVLSYLERENFISCVGNEFSLNISRITEEGVTSIAGKLANEVMFRLKFVSY